MVIISDSPKFKSNVYTVYLYNIFLFVVNSQQFVANLTRCAENNQTFCTKNDEYPLEHVKNLLREHATRFADVVTDIESNDITDRIEFDDNVDEYMCSSYEKVIYPKTGKTQDGQELFIFNTDDYKQGVRVSMCRNAGQPCKLTENFPNGVKTECKQQFVYRQLLSLSSGGQPIKDHFEFPACCSCVLHRR